MHLRDYFEDGPRRDWDTDPAGTVRLAVVGLGGFARDAALPAIADADYAETTVVVSGTPETRRAVADDRDARGLDYEAYRAGEATDAYDAVYVATPNRLHLPNVRAAADHGKAVCCEKPLEATVDRAEAAVEACDDAGVTLMTAYRMQADPATRRLREFVRDGGVGDPVKFGGDFTFPVLAGDRGPDHWRLDPELAGGGALMDVGVYPLNLARFLVDADPVAVSGTTRTSERFAPVDEHVAFTVELADGTTGSPTASFSGHADARFWLAGTEGRVDVGDAFQPNRNRRVTLERDGGRVVVEGVGAPELREQFDYFAHCVLTGERPEPDGRDGLVDVRTADAVYRAADTGARREL